MISGKTATNWTVFEIFIFPIRPQSGTITKYLGHDIISPEQIKVTLTLTLTLTLTRILTRTQTDLMMLVVESEVITNGMR